MRTTIVTRRHQAVPRQFRHDEIPRVIDVQAPRVPQHDEVSLAGGDKTDKPWTGSQALVHTHFDLDDGHHRGPLRWNGDRLWAPRRRMRTARENAGMTQYQLAVATGLTVTSIANLERGRTRYPRMMTMERIATALGVELRWLADD